MTRPAPPAWQVWAALGIVYVVWGSTYLGIAYVVETLPPLLSAAARFAVAAVLVVAWVLVRRGRRALTATGAQLLGAALVGLLLLLGGNGLVTVAEDAELPSGLAALLVAAVPLWVVLLRVAARDRPSRRTLIGVGLGFVGVAVLLLPDARPHDVPVVAAVLVVAASFLWSAGTFAATRLEMPRDGLVTAGVEMAVGAVGLAVAGAMRGERLVVEQVSASSLVALGYLVVFGSLVAFTAYSWLLSVAPVSKVATYAYVNPVVAVALGAVMLGEAVPGATLLGGLLTVVAVALVVREEGGDRAGWQADVGADADRLAPAELEPVGRRDDEQPVGVSESHAAG